MFDPDAATKAQGEDLLCLIREIRREFFVRSACDEFDSGFRQINSVRVVTVDVYDGLSVEAQLGVIANLLQSNPELTLSRDAEEVFVASDSPLTYITDLVCEVVWQTLMDDPLVRMEDESREALAGY